MIYDQSQDPFEQPPGGQSYNETDEFPEQTVDATPSFIYTPDATGRPGRRTVIIGGTALVAGIAMVAGYALSRGGDSEDTNAGISEIAANSLPETTISLPETTIDPLRIPTESFTADNLNIPVLTVPIETIGNSLPADEALATSATSETPTTTLLPSTTAAATSTTTLPPTTTTEALAITLPTLEASSSTEPAQEASTTTEQPAVETTFDTEPAPTITEPEPEPDTAPVGPEPLLTLPTIEDINCDARGFVMPFNVGPDWVREQAARCGNSVATWDALNSDFNPDFPIAGEWVNIQGTIPTTEPTVTLPVIETTVPVTEPAPTTEAVDTTEAPVITEETTTTEVATTVAPTTEVTTTEAPEPTIASTTSTTTPPTTTSTSSTAPSTTVEPSTTTVAPETTAAPTTTAPVGTAPPITTTGSRPNSFYPLIDCNMDSVTLPAGMWLGRLAEGCGIDLSSLLANNPSISDPNSVVAGTTIYLQPGIAPVPEAPIETPASTSPASVPASTTATSVATPDTTAPASSTIRANNNYPWINCEQESVELVDGMWLGRLALGCGDTMEELLAVNPHITDQDNVPLGTTIYLP